MQVRTCGVLAPKRLREARQGTGPPDCAAPALGAGGAPGSLHRGSLCGTENMHLAPRVCSASCRLGAGVPLQSH